MNVFAQMLQALVAPILMIVVVMAVFMSHIVALCVLLAFTAMMPVHLVMTKAQDRWLRRA